MQSKNAWIYVGVLGLIVIASCAVFYAVWASRPNANAAVDRDTLFQVAAFNTFSAGNYDGYMPYSELSRYGDFGIGTFHGLDGEMIALNGVFYQIPVDGKPRQAASGSKTPYATVTFFEADETLSVAGPLNYPGLMAAIDALLPADGAIYAIKISATYDYAQTRSVPIQTKPYPPLAEVIKNQSVFVLYNVSGTAAGFWFPSSMDGVDFAGYHLHLITDDLTAGGHLLDCTARSITIEIDQINNYHLMLP